MKTINCKICEKEFHFCSSCDYDPYAYEGFCSKECWEKSAEYKEKRSLSLNFYTCLSMQQKEMCWELMNTVLDDDIYYQEFQKWLDVEEDRPFKNKGKND